MKNTLPAYEMNILLNQYEKYGLDVAEKSTVVNKELAQEFVEYLLDELNFFLDDDWPDAEMRLAEKWFEDKVFAVDSYDNYCVIENLEKLLRLRQADMMAGVENE